MYDFLARHTGTAPRSFDEVAEVGNQENYDLRDLRRNGTLTTNARYDLSHFAVRWLVDRFGAEAQFEYWRALARLGNQNAAFEETFGMTLGAFEAEFETFRRGAPGAKNVSSDRAKDTERGRRPVAATGD